MATSTKQRSSRSRTSRTPPPTILQRLIALVVKHVSDQKTDVVGIGLVLVGVLGGLALYGGRAGAVGDFLEAMFRGLFGVIGHAVPPALVALGLVVVIGRVEEQVGRLVVGGSVLTLALVGGLHLAVGMPRPDEGVKALWPGGGILGWTIARPLELGLSGWGASAVLMALGMVGLLILTKTSVATLLAAFRTGVADSAPDDGQPKAIKRTRTPAADDTSEIPRTPIRATLAGKVQQAPDGAPGNRHVEQPTLDFNGRSAADQAAGRAPEPPRPAATVATQKATRIKPVTDWADYKLPPLDLLGMGRSLGKSNHAHIKAQVATLQETLDQFGVDAQVSAYSRGPTVTRFEIELGPGVQVKRVASLGDDIAYALAAPDIRIVAPIPGKSAIGVEVPNHQRDLITLGDILRSDTARSDHGALTVALGVDIAGNPAMVNLTTMPHLLVSGATGSGKSVTLNSFITSVVMRTRPDQVRMILIDPKRVELNAYQGAPHLLTPVVTDPKRATDAVQWCVKEMEMRYETLARLGFRNIDGYNDSVAAKNVPAATAEEAETYRHMPYILLVIDELADLMLVAPRDVEDAICRIAQMARAVGIHMVIATQRPSVDVITGLIKANIPSRLSLAVASQTDSRTILDGAGAEKLVGHGDMLFLPASQGKPSRLQGCFVSEKEVEGVVAWCRRQRDADFIDGVVREGDAAWASDARRSGDDNSDEALLARAAIEVVNSGLGSTSMLQRKLRIGFARAGRLMDELEQLGVVGPNEGSKARDVLWTPEDVENAQEQGLL